MAVYVIGELVHGRSHGVVLGNGAVRLFALFGAEDVLCDGEWVPCELRKCRRLPKGVLAKRSQIRIRFVVHLHRTF